MGKSAVKLRLPALLKRNLSVAIRYFFGFVKSREKNIFPIPQSQYWPGGRTGLTSPVTRRIGGRWFQLERAQCAYSRPAGRAGKRAERAATTRPDQTRPASLPARHLPPRRCNNNNNNRLKGKLSKPRQASPEPKSFVRPYGQN